MPVKRCVENAPNTDVISDAGGACRVCARSFVRVRIRGGRGEFRNRLQSFAKVNTRLAHVNSLSLPSLSSLPFPVLLSSLSFSMIRRRRGAVASRPIACDTTTAATASILPSSFQISTAKSDHRCGCISSYNLMLGWRRRCHPKPPMTRCFRVTQKPAAEFLKSLSHNGYIACYQLLL